MLRLNQSLWVEIKHFQGLIWPPRGLTQKGEGTKVGAGSPWPTSQDLLNVKSAQTLILLLFSSRTVGRRLENKEAQPDNVQLRTHADTFVLSRLKHRAYWKCFRVLRLNSNLERSKLPVLHFMCVSDPRVCSLERRHLRIFGGLGVSQ
jgi:hypothetical protein